jgi:hypothetical protein
MTLAQLAKFLEEHDLQLEVQCTSGTWTAKLRHPSAPTKVWVAAQDPSMLGAILIAIKWAMQAVPA